MSGFSAATHRENNLNGRLYAFRNYGSYLSRHNTLVIQAFNVLRLFIFIAPAIFNWVAGW